MERAAKVKKPQISEPSIGRGGKGDVRDLVLGARARYSWVEVEWSLMEISKAVVDGQGVSAIAEVSGMETRVRLGYD